MDASTLAYLLAAATHLSGLPPLQKLPEITPVSAIQMVATVCPQVPSDCRSLQAVYETEGNHILYLDTLDMEVPEDASFLVHEITHALQYQARGDAIFAGCNAMMATEKEAYAVQNKFLQREGRLLRVGEMLRFARCPDDIEI